MFDVYLATLKATKPNSADSNVSTPVAEACQWAASEIEALRAECAELRSKLERYEETA